MWGFAKKRLQSLGPDRARTSSDLCNGVTYFPSHSPPVRGMLSLTPHPRPGSRRKKGAVHGTALLELQGVQGEVICEKMRGLVVISALGTQESCVQREEVSCFGTQAGSQDDSLYSPPNLI